MKSNPRVLATGRDAPVKIAKTFLWMPSHCFVPLFYLC